MRTKLLRTIVLGVAFGIVSCGGSVKDSSGEATTVLIPTGGYPDHATGGTPTAGDGGASNAGYPATGGAATGGAATGGKSATGGVTTGGTATGGMSPTGGTATGGTATGGKSATGGIAAGGTATGGKSATGGMAAGGTMSTGGAFTGGKSAIGGAATGGATTTSTSASDPCLATNSLSGGTKHCSQNDSGSYGSYQWQVWSNQTAGCLTTYNNAGGAFSANWENSGDFLARVGLVFDGTKTYQELGTFSADFAETHTGSAGAYSYIGIYGWMASPSIEFYIVEDSFNSPPVKPFTGNKLGVIQVDGGAYDVYYSETTGTTPTYDIFSIRQTLRHCGHISISDHFSQWASLGLSLGKMTETRIIVEALSGTGSIDFTTASVVVN